MLDKELQISFYGGTETVTGANFLLNDSKNKFLIDCGLFQGLKIGDERNRDPFPYDPKEIDILFITHAHIDHVGRIPKLVKDGFKGKIYSTKPTKEIAGLMLHDSLNVLTHEASHEGKDPIFEEMDIVASMKLWRTLDYHEDMKVGDFSVRLLDAGHILGSAMISFTYNNKKIVFTGDLGNSPAPLLRDTEEINDSCYVVMESVYGDRNHEPKEERSKMLRQAILETIKNKGALIVPAFSLERSQELLYEINNMVENKTIPEIPIFLDSPLAIKVTEIYKKSSTFFNEKTKHIISSGDDIFNFKGLKKTLLTEESKAINFTPNPKVIIAGSGMSNGGRIMHHEKRYLPDRNSIILLVGYQAIGTPGRLIEEGVRDINILGDRVPIRAKIINIRGYSAHKDSDQLVEFASTFGDKLKKVFLAMGEPKATLFLAQRLQDSLNIDASVPKNGDTVKIDVS